MIAHTVRFLRNILQGLRLRAAWRHARLGWSSAHYELLTLIVLLSAYAVVGQIDAQVQSAAASEGEHNRAKTEAALLSCLTQGGMVGNGVLVVCSVSEVLEK